jgi:PadR family transcriptional regulator, regulatory protein PadR
VAGGFSRSSFGGPQHGYGITRRIEQVSQQVLQLNEGTVYTSLLRLQQRRWIASDWGMSENNRKAKYYSITKIGAYYPTIFSALDYALRS